MTSVIVLPARVIATPSTVNSASRPATSTAEFWITLLPSVRPRAWGAPPETLARVMPAAPVVSLVSTSR